MMQALFNRCIISLLFVLLLPHSMVYAQREVSKETSPENAVQAPLMDEESSYDDAQESQDFNQEQEKIPQDDEPRIINDIIVHGNKHISTNAILSYCPYKIGEVFDPLKTRQLIKNLYFGLGRFRTISIKGQHVNSDKINIHLIVDEKKILKDVVLEGNKAISEKEIRKKVNFDIPTIDPEQLKSMARQIKQMYSEKGYSKADVATELAADADDNATALFKVTEGPHSLVKRIEFTGNSFASSKQLRNVIFTKEDWILGFMGQSGTYIPERLEGDKHMIEQFYQNAGFMRAKVTHIDVQQDPRTQNITLVFDIEEGDRYSIGKVQAPGNEVLSEDFLLPRIALYPGQWYSRKKVGDAIKLLEQIWGNFGYIFASIDPSIEPNEETKTVDISFFSEVGNKIYLDRINILGNTKTRDKIIRRRIPLIEGDLLTNGMLEQSKVGVESLGYFDPADGVNWKLRRIDDENADVDIMVKEGRTGQFNFQLGYGGAGADLSSPSTGINAKLIVADRNLFGSGVDFNLECSFAKEEQTFVFHAAQPWLFDKPIAGSFDLYHKRPSYTAFRNVNGAINEKITGGALTAGFITSPGISVFSDVQILGSLGFDNVQFQKRPLANFSPGVPGSVILNAQLQGILDREFSGGNFLWLSNTIEQNYINHPMHPSRGHKWRTNAKVALPTFDDRIGFYKLTFDFDWFTPIIGERDLVLHLHTFLGFAQPYGNHNIPYNELFNIGGPGSVRGYLFGQVGPRFLGDAIGATKAFFVNTELLFPITRDFSFKGAIFYDGGSGFDTPFKKCVGATDAIHSNGFDYRHAVGFGIRILNPMPIRIDWGFKIDPRKDRNNPDNSESPYEVHFGMNYGW